MEAVLDGDGVTSGRLSDTPSVATPRPSAEALRILSIGGSGIVHGRLEDKARAGALC